MKEKFVKNVVMMVVTTIVCMATFTACSRDDDNEPISGDSTNALVISGQSYGNLPFAQFINWGDGTASFIFSSVRMVSNLDQNSPITFLSVRIPYSSTGIPTGTFSADVDADFDVNRIPSTQTCDLTGWCIKLTMTVVKSGDNYVVDFETNDLHIFHSDNETGNGQSGSLTMHFEGKVELVSYN